MTDYPPGKKGLKCGLLWEVFLEPPHPRPFFFSAPPALACSFINSLLQCIMILCLKVSLPELLKEKKKAGANPALLEPLLKHGMLSLTSGQSLPAQSFP